MRRKATTYLRSKAHEEQRELVQVRCVVPEQHRERLESTIRADPQRKVLLQHLAPHEQCIHDALFLFSSFCLHVVRLSWTHVDNLRARKLAALDALLRVDSEHDERAEQWRRVEPQPAHVTELPEGELVEQLFAVYSRCKTVSARVRYKERGDRGVRDGTVVDEVELGRVLNERETLVHVDDADEAVLLQDLRKLCEPS